MIESPELTIDQATENKKAISLLVNFKNFKNRSFIHIHEKEYMMREGEFHHAYENGTSL